MTLSKRPVVKLFLSVATVPYRYPSEGPRPLRFRASWVVRGATGHCLYQSKICESQAEVVRLAQKWLVKNNAPAGYPVYLRDTRTLYVDTTDQPERYGYSHQVEGGS